MEIKNNIAKIKVSLISKLAFLILLIIFFSESIEVLIFNTSDMWEYSTFFSSSTEGHVQLLLLLFLFPIFIIVFYSSRIHNEISPSLVHIYCKDKFSYFKEKLTFIFLLTFILLIVLISVDLLINYFRILIVSQNSNFEAWNQLGDLSFDKLNWPFLYIKRLHPLLAIILYSLFTSLYFALLATFVTSVVFVVSDIKTVYLFTFGVNLFLTINPIYPNGKIFQPFVEGTFSNFILTAVFCYFIFIVLILIIGIIYFRKGDYVE